MLGTGLEQGLSQTQTGKTSALLGLPFHGGPEGWGCPATQHVPRVAVRRGPTLARVPVGQRAKGCLAIVAGCWLRWPQDLSPVT